MNKELQILGLGLRKIAFELARGFLGAFFVCAAFVAACGVIVLVFAGALWIPARISGQALNEGFTATYGSWGVALIGVIAVLYIFFTARAAGKKELQHREALRDFEGKEK